VAAKRKSKRKSETLEDPELSDPELPDKDQLIAMFVEKMKGVKPDPNYVPPPRIENPPGQPPPEPAMSYDEYCNWRKRTVAELISLPMICPVRQCRRLRSCLIEEAICLTWHRERAAQRVNLMLGWDACELFDEDDA
jgi:hypothetical protein